MWHGGNSGGTRHRVGEKSPNVHGLYDTQGNVGQVCTSGRNLVVLGGDGMTGLVRSPMQTDGGHGKVSFNVSVFPFVSRSWGEGDLWVGFRMAVSVPVV